MKVLGVIPARGGSKGVPRKNLRELSGRPLIAYTLDTAAGARALFHRTIVSTDNQEIASVCRALGADVPFIRPADLAGDRVPMVPVVRHAIEFVERVDGVRLDWVCLLQPTEPFRTAEDLSKALAIAAEGDCDSVISVVQVFSVHPVRMKRIESSKLLPFCVEEREGTARQDLSPAAYMRNGAIYLTRRDVVMDRHSLWGDVIRPYIMPDDRSTGIDSEIDLKLAEVLMNDRLSRS